MNETNIDVTDNFLAHEEFITLRDTITDENFPWFYNQHLMDYEDCLFYT